MKTKFFHRFAAALLAVCLLVMLAPTALAATYTQAEGLISTANGQNNFDYQYGSAVLVDAGSEGGVATKVFSVPAGRKSGDVYAAVLPVTQSGAVAAGTTWGDVRYVRLSEQNGSLTMTYFRENCRYFCVKLVQPLPDGGQSAITSNPAMLSVGGTGNTSLTLTATLTMSADLARLADLHRADPRMNNLTFTAHVRFAPGIDIQFDTSNFKLNSRVFEIAKVETSANEHGYDIKCRLRSDWTKVNTGETLVEKLLQQMSFTTTVTIPAAALEQAKNSGYAALNVMGWTTVEGWPLNRVWVNSPAVQVPAAMYSIPLNGVADPASTGVGQLLNYMDHIAYMRGDTAGTFRPDAGIKRSEVAQMFYNLLLSKNVFATASFSDVAKGYWYYDAVTTLASLGIINGYPNGTFGPDRPITRAEFVTIAARFATAVEGATCNFTDVAKNHWAYKNICTAVTYGWIEGRGDNKFAPEDNLTRAEAATIVNRMLGRAADKSFVNAHASDLKKFPDVLTNQWFYYTIAEATNAHNHTGINNSEEWTGLK